MHSTDTSDDAALFAACVGAPAVVVAMAEEAQPFLDLATAGCSIPQQVGGAQLHALALEGRGLRADVNVGDLVVGAQCRDADAAAPAFGSAPGQRPGMPESFDAAGPLLSAAEHLAAEEGRQLWRGTMLSGGSFVTAENVGVTRELFPEALSTDMETTALAQVCGSHETPFLAVRSISDLCGPAADQQFHLELDVVAGISARAVCRLLSALEDTTRV